jgi:hypothetical protein
MVTHSHLFYAFVCLIQSVPQQVPNTGSTMLALLPNLANSGSHGSLETKRQDT